jgi:hypothetical protein
MMFNEIIFKLSGLFGVNGRPGGAHKIATELRSHGWDIEVLDFVATKR